jgi:CRISPR-associated protein Csm4
MFASALSPYKKTVLLYDEGAVFTSETPLEYAGTLLTGVHSDPRICQAAFAPVIAIA